MKLSQLKIDPEFQSKIPPLQFEEEQQLEQNIIAEGRLLNPIVTWNGYILDGHTRYRILKKHGFIKFEVEEIQLANKYEALAWICKNQLGRRNLSPERKKFLLGKEYESTKLAVGAPLGSKHGIRKCGQNDHIFTESRTCQRIASEHGVQGAAEDFVFRWDVVFQEHPEVLTDKACRKKLSELMDRMMSYLKTVKEEKL